MNLPNKLTILRMAMVPFMVLFFYLEGEIFTYISVIIFIIATFTDFLDGYIARKKNLVTDFGKFMDPLADKALVLVALILVVDVKVIPFPYIASLSLAVMLVRELVVSGLRLVGANKGIVIAADKLGKFKTVAQDVALPILLLLPAIPQGSFYDIFLLIGVILLIFASVISIISGISYILKNKELFKGAK